MIFFMNLRKRFRYRIGIISFEFQMTKEDIKKGLSEIT